MKNIVGKNVIFQLRISTYNTEKGYEEYTVTKIEDEKGKKRTAFILDSSDDEQESNVAPPEKKKDIKLNLKTPEAMKEDTLKKVNG